MITNVNVWFDVWAATVLPRGENEKRTRFLVTSFSDGFYCTAWAVASWELLAARFSQSMKVGFKRSTEVHTALLLNWTLYFFSYRSKTTYGPSYFSCRMVAQHRYEQKRDLLVLSPLAQISTVSLRGLYQGWVSIDPWHFEEFWPIRVVVLLMVLDGTTLQGDEVTYRTPFRQMYGRCLIWWYCAARAVLSVVLMFSTHIPVLWWLLSVTCVVAPPCRLPGGDRKMFLYVICRMWMQVFRKVRIRTACPSL
jgi:hypothetical protein